MLAEREAAPVDATGRDDADEIRHSRLHVLTEETDDLRRLIEVADDVHVDAIRLGDNLWSPNRRRTINFADDLGDIRDGRGFVRRPLLGLLDWIGAPDQHHRADDNESGEDLHDSIMTQPCRPVTPRRCDAPPTLPR